MLRDAATLPSDIISTYAFDTCRYFHADALRLFLHATLMPDAAAALLIRATSLLFR